MKRRIIRKLSKFWIIIFVAFCWACSVRPPAELEPGKLEDSDLPITLTEVNPRALKHFMDGEMLMLQGKYPMAILEFQDALTYDSSSPSILTSLADAYMKLGKFNRAEEQIKELLTFDPKNRDALELLGHQYLIQGKVEQARIQYLLLKDFYPGIKDYQYILAEIAMREGELQSAQDQFWKIYENDTLEHRALIRAAEIAREREDFPFALKAFGLLVKANPSNIPYLRTYCELAVFLNEFSIAISGLERLVNLTDDDPKVLERLAIIYFDQDEIGKADSILQHLYKENHLSPGVFYYLSRIAIVKEDYEIVELYSAKFVETYPDEQSGYTNLAIAYINLDKTLDAISILLKARNLFPDDFAVNFLLGNSYNIESNYNLAKQSLLLALNIEPNSRPAKHLLATVYNQLKEWESSDILYNELIEKEKDDGQALNNYSYTLAQRGIKLDLALEMALKANNLEPDNPAYLDTIGWIYFKLGKYKKALQHIEKSIAIEQSNAVVLEHMGDTLVKVEKVDEAKEYFKKALKLDLENERLLQKIEGK